jgi:hypothetical protein
MYTAKVAVPPTGVIILNPSPINDGRYTWEIIREDGSSVAGLCATPEEGLKNAKEVLKL